MTSVTVMNVNGERYALETIVVHEVLPVPRISRVPAVPRSILGITNVRGRVVPVVDLRQKLGAPAPPPGPDSRIVLVGHGDEEVGLLVDGVQGVLSLSDAAPLEPPPVGGTRDELVSHMIRQEQAILLMLDLAAVLRPGKGETTGGRLHEPGV